MTVYIDAGIENITIQEGHKKRVLKSNDFNRQLPHENFQNKRIISSGKLAGVIQEKYGGENITAAAALWYQAKKLAAKYKQTIGIIELSASGYFVIAVDKKGDLIDDVLTINPKCGAGSGINLKRILEKLDIAVEDVDEILKSFLGESAKKKRSEIPIRADRCGVFSSSATISDKNQGIPLEFALAVTMKSEVVKVCRKMIKTDKVFLTGGVFLWKFMRKCAEDYLASIGVKSVEWEEDFILSGMEALVEEIGSNFRRQEEKISKAEKMFAYPSFARLKEKYEKSGLYKRLEDSETHTLRQADDIAVNIALDVGSTMAKVVVADRDDNIIFKSSYNNHGDTVHTIKHIFSRIKNQGMGKLKIQHIGLTGSGRYQVQTILRKVYPHLQERIFVLVENYAHAYGSVKYAKQRLKTIKDANQDFCVLVDIGGEDTKVSVISLKEEELFDNVMNTKCSAGTGSLMDTLQTMFKIEKIEDAYLTAYQAPKAYEINATCAVFLMENAKKMQCKGFRKSEILASCCYAIVENMAKTLWNQIDFPPNAVVLLHGQTMLSDPLPLSVTHKLQEKARMFCLIPPFPGHRACVGLLQYLKKMKTHAVAIDEKCDLSDFIDLEFQKKIFFCQGAVCRDNDACCARTRLSTTINDWKVSLQLGGCTAINNLNKAVQNETVDAYKTLWEFINSNMPRAKDKKRLIIPRSFAVSEYAYLLAKLFEKLGIPAYVDNVIEKDILEGQPFFNVDVCAPLIGAVGQYCRLAQEQHGIILAPQIDFLPTGEVSLGKTCTTNQGGISIARQAAMMKNPAAKIIEVNISHFDKKRLVNQLLQNLPAVFDFYGIAVNQKMMFDAVDYAFSENDKLAEQVNLKTLAFFEYAIVNKRNISIVCAREYILNPGIYDSHTGRLLKDKGMIAIPSYVLKTKLNPDYAHIYWRNPHDLTSKTDAIAKQKLHEILYDSKLKQVVEKIEKGLTKTSMSIVQVSTFRCGPDSVILPTINEITKNFPALFIQSDAMIQELAHLENRVNTHIRQISKKLNREFSKEHFKIEVINDFGTHTIDKSSDVLYFPTLHDNRVVTSAFKAAGITVIDNYDDETFNLKEKIQYGRKYVGDSVCAPLAAVFADIMLAIEDFRKKKKQNDPVVENKSRVLIFDNKGSGPCRQGQYFEQHKLNIYQHHKHDIDKIKLLVSQEDNAYNTGLEEWALILAFQGAVIHGVLQSILLKGSMCKNVQEFNDFSRDYLALKKNIYRIIENAEPSHFRRKMSNKTANMKTVSFIVKYFAYGLHHNYGIRKALQTFSRKWLAKEEKKERLNIYMEGEAYMRGAQLEDIFRAIIDSIGFDSFQMEYSPVWCYFELLIEFAILEIDSQMKQKHSDKDALKELLKQLKKVEMMKKLFRKILVEPLYKAARLTSPETMSEVLTQTKKILPNIKPRGELPAYIGEAILKINSGVDLFINVAPEGCMVSSMGHGFNASISRLTEGKARIQDLFSLDGEVDEEALTIALLKAMGPLQYYSSNTS